MAGSAAEFRYYCGAVGQRGGSPRAGPPFSPSSAPCASMKAPPSMGPPTVVGRGLLSVRSGNPRRSNKQKEADRPWWQGSPSGRCPHRRVRGCWIPGQARNDEGVTAKRHSCASRNPAPPPPAYWIPGQARNDERVTVWVIHDAVYPPVIPATGRPPGETTSFLRKNVTPYPGSSPGQALIRGRNPAPPPRLLDSGSSPE